LDFSDVIVGTAFVLLTADPLLLIVVPDDFSVEAFVFFVEVLLPQRSGSLEDEAAVFLDAIGEDDFCCEAFVDAFSPSEVLHSTSFLFSDEIDEDGLQVEAFIVEDFDDAFSATMDLSLALIFLGG